MRKPYILIYLILFILVKNTNAQQALFGGQEIVSPEINDDQTVTFRIQAAAAGEVKIAGDWLPPDGWMPGSVKMDKDDKGLWTHTTDVLLPELYSYSFQVDGVKTLDPNNVFVSRDVASLSNTFIIHGGQADLYKVNEVPHGTVTRRWYNSPELEMNRRITIYTPPGYENSVETYPVLYLLHGAGGDEEAWITLGRTAQILDNLIASGKAKPMIVVMPNGNVSQEAAPGEETRGYYKPQFMVPKSMDGTFEETFLDIIKFVEESYRVKTDKSDRAIAGLSMGGFHSLHISKYYPNTFDYVGLFSAAIIPQPQVTSKVYANFEEGLIRQNENGYKVYWVGIGKTDFLYKNVKEYREVLDKLGMPYTYVESEGGHIWRNWRVYLSDFVPQLFN